MLILSILIQLGASAVAAFRTELFFAHILDNEGKSIGDDIPIGVCWHVEDSGNYRGDRMCNNAMGAAVSTVIIAVMLLIIDMIVPCLSAGVSKSIQLRVFHNLCMDHVNYCID